MMYENKKAGAYTMRLRFFVLFERYFETCIQLGLLPLNCNV